METQSAAAAWEQLQIMAASFFNGSRLIETACEKFADVDEASIQQLRASYLDQMKQQSVKGTATTAQSLGDSVIL